MKRRRWGSEDARRPLGKLILLKINDWNFVIKRAAATLWGRDFVRKVCDAAEV